MDEIYIDRLHLLNVPVDYIYHEYKYVLINNTINHTINNITNIINYLFFIDDINKKIKNYKIS